MAKALRTAAIIVGSVALIATGVGAFAGTFIGASVLGGFGAAASVAATAGTIAAYASVAAAGLSIGATLLAKPPPLGGTVTKFKADPGAPLPYLMGRTATGGNIVYRRTHNTVGYSIPDLQTFAVILSACGPVQSIDTFYADRVATSFSSGSAVGNYATWMWQRQQLGATPESAAMSTAGLPGRTGKITSAAPGWGSSAKLSGYAAALWTLRYDKDGDQYTNGIPQPLWVGHWVKVYDPRLDSTYPGGSGSCRALNESTYVWSENPYLHGLTWALGRWQNGKRVMGIGAPVAGIDVAAFVEGANIADTNGWKIGGGVSSRDNKWSVLKSILQAGAGEPIHVGAMISCIVSTPRVTIATVTVNDVIGTAKVAATTPRRGRINSIIPRYRSEDHDWEFVSGDPVTVSAHVTTDGGLRETEISYSLVQDVNQAAVMARYDIENTREFGPVTLPLKPRWMGYKPGDCVAVELPEIGLNGQPVVIRNRSIDPQTGMATLISKSETDAKHPFALGQTTTAPPTPSVTTPPVAPQPGASDWSIASTNLTAGASVTPALVITGSAVDAPVDAVVFEYRLWVSGQAADDGWIIAGTDLPTVVRKEITAILPGTAYEVAVRYTLRGFPGDRRVLGPVTTSGEYSTPGDNLIPNAGLAIDTAGWYVSNLAYRVDGTSTDPAPGYFQFPVMGVGVSALVDTPRLAVAGAPRVFVSGWSFRVSGATGSFYANLFWYDSAGNFLTAETNYFGLMPAVNGWQPFSFTAPRPADAAFVLVRVVADNISQLCNVAGMRLSLTQRGADQTRTNYAAGMQPGGLLLQDSGPAIIAAAQPFTLLASDGVALSWALDRAPTYTFDTSSLPALASGESYSVQMVSVTGSGGTPRLKKRTTGGSPVNLTSSAGTAIITGEDYSAEKADSRDARDGLYSFRVQGQFDRLFNYTPFGGGGSGGGGAGEYVREQ